MLPSPEPSFDLTHAQILYLMLALQLSLFGLGWKVAIRPPPGLHAAVKGMAAFNLAVAVSMVLIGMRGHGPYFVTHTVSNLLTLWGIVALVQATDQLAHLKMSQLELMLVLLLGGLGILVLGLSTQYSQLRVSALLFSIAWLTSRAGFKALKLQFKGRESRAAKAMAATAWVVAAMFVWRGLAGLWSTQSIEFDTSSPATLSMAFVLLVAVFSVNVAIAFLINARAQRHRQQLAPYDPLTGLPQRAVLLNTLNHEWNLHKKQKKPFSVICIDLDRFKQIEDAFGSKVSDHVVLAVTAQLRHQLQPSDIIGRSDDDEFLVILPTARVAAARLVAEYMRESVFATQGLLPDAKDRVSVSIGVAQAADTDDSADALIARALESLRQAKAGGRNRVVVDATGSAVSSRPMPAGPQGQPVEAETISSAVG